MRFKTTCRLCDVSDTQGIWVPSFDWVSYVDVHVVLVCEHFHDLRICVLWLLLPVYVLVHVLDFAFVLC